VVTAEEDNAANLEIKSIKKSFTTSNEIYVL